MLVKALAIPALSMQPAPSRLPITFVMPEVVPVTVTLTEVECVSDPEAPLTVSVKVEGITEGPRLTVNVAETEPPLGGVTELGLKNAETPLGTADTLRAAGE